MADVEREIERFEPAAMRQQIRRSWDEEARLATVSQARENTAAQMPFHFWEMGDAYSRFMQADETVYAPEVLAHFAAQGYGGFEWLDHLRWIRRPMLVMVGRYDRTCTLARSEEIHNEVEGSDRAPGFHAVFGRISASSEASIALHRSCGFELVGIEREVGRKFNKWLDVAIMQALL